MQISVAATVAKGRPDRIPAYKDTSSTYSTCCMYLERFSSHFHVATHTEPQYSQSLATGHSPQRGR